LTEYDAWKDLDALSTHTGVDSIYVDPVGIELNGDRFRGLAAIYVALQYARLQTNSKGSLTAISKARGRSSTRSPWTPARSTNETHTLLRGQDPKRCPVNTLNSLGNAPFKIAGARASACAPARVTPLWQVAANAPG
jgi:hypothetical protein